MTAPWDGIDRRHPRTRSERLWRWLDSPRATAVLVSVSTTFVLLTIGLLSIVSNQRAQEGIDQVDKLGRCLLANVDDHRANSYEHFLDAGQAHRRPYVPPAGVPKHVDPAALAAACRRFADR